MDHSWRAHDARRASSRPSDRDRNRRGYLCHVGSGGVEETASRGTPEVCLRPLTAPEVRAEVARLPEQYREQALRLLASAWDEGLSAGLVNAARSRNPFLPATVKPKGKAR